MKISVLGNGHVGSAVFERLKQMRELSEIMLIGRNEDKILGEIEDYKDAEVFDILPTPKVDGGGYEKIINSDIIVYTISMAAPAEFTRRDQICSANIKLTNEIIEKIRPYCKNDPFIIVITNPLDVITYQFSKSGLTKENRIIGTGTMLESARLARRIAYFFDISPRSVYAPVVGEHGSSAVTIWSVLKVSGHDIDTYASNDMMKSVKIERVFLEENMKKQGWKIQTLKGNTNHGVVSIVIYIINAIIHDTKEIMNVSTSMLSKYGYTEFALSVPCIIGAGGIRDVILLKMTREEKEELDKSAEVLRNMIRCVQIGL
ncbi:MAG TPA: hypothetical protein PL032_13620 [Syntrophorhabdus sp.]|nr:MAG: L-lactate dehydrogenase [Deltaproteobacteria bacterium ADurb.Bin135]HOH28005.1 hypothetical protein [Syntrophorhabdus sp.]